MSLSTMTTNGRTTIPKDIRDGLGLRPKDQINFTMMADGTVIMRAKNGASPSCKACCSA